jgi:signal transduction histidine kinase
MFVAGANPRLVLDDSYQEFLAEIAHLVSQALNHLLAREQEHLAERRLRNAQRLQAVGALAGGVAHEVNNQMTVVLGMGEFVLRRLGPNHAVAADVRSVLEAGSRAARVSQQLLTFTRQQFTQPQVLDPATVMAEVEQLLTELLGDRGILRVVVQPGVSLISADRGQLEQALVDLVANARDALGSGGEVTITVSDVRLTSESSGSWGFTVTPGGYVQVAVADNGHGMDEATLGRIFDPFFTTKPVGQGPGLGLSMVYGVVKRHDGYVWAESRPGQGTTMRLFWPAVSETVRDASLHRGGGTGLGKSPDGPPTVWVVEDEANVRELLARTLTEEGMRVVTAADGAEALGLMETEMIPPALVITDLVMPRVHGRQVADALARRYPEASVLFMSGYAADDMVRRGLLPANAAFLQKPFSPSQLVQALGAIVG